MSYSANNFPMPIVVANQPVASNLSIFDMNFNAVSRHLANVANLNSGNTSYGQANSAYNQANNAYNQANAAYNKANSGSNFGDLTASNTTITSINSDTNINIKSNISNPIWIATFGDLAQSNSNYTSSVVIDSANNIYMFGADSNSSNTNYIVKFDSNGNEIWQKQIGDPVGFFKMSDALHIDNDDFIYLSLNENEYPVSNTYTVKLDTDANIIWQTNLTGFYRAYEYSITSDSNGNVITVGQQQDYGNNSYTILMCKFDSDGNLLWQNLLANTNGEYGYGVVTDSNDNIIFTGVIDDYSQTKWLVGKYDNDGIRIWEKTIQGSVPGIGETWGSDVTVDELDRIFVLGTNGTYNAEEGFPATVVAFDSSGNYLWGQGFGDYGCKYYMYGTGIVYDNGSLYVTSGVYSGDFNLDSIFAARINVASTSLDWINEIRDATGNNYSTYQFYNNSPDRPIAVRNGVIALGAYSYIDSPDNYRAVLIKAPADGTGLGSAGPFAWAKSRVPYRNVNLNINNITLSITSSLNVPQPGDLSVSVLDSSYNVALYSGQTQWSLSNTGALVFPDGSKQYSASPHFDQALYTFSYPQFSSLTLTENYINFSGNGGGEIYYGGGTAYFQSYNGEIWLQSNTNHNTQTWQFKIDGSLVFPNSYIINPASSSQFANVNVDTRLTIGASFENTDVTYFQRTNVDNNLTTLDIFIGDDGSGNTIPQPSSTITDYLAIRTTDNNIHHLFGTDGNYSLGGSINFSDGTVQNTAWTGTVNTGDVTFSGVTVQGQYAMLSIAPDSTFTSGGQYFRFRGGDDPSHLHFDTNNNGAFDLFVGDDSKYVKVAKEGHIELRPYNGPANTFTFNPDGSLVGSIANSTISTDSYNWVFDNTGVLTFPDGATVNQSGFYAANGSNAVLGQFDGNTQVYTQQTGVGIQTYDGSTHTWTFNDVGNLVFPDTTQQNTAYTATFNNLTPSSSTDVGTKGDIVYDSSYVYICVAANTWIRAALTGGW